MFFIFLCFFIIVLIIAIYKSQRGAYNRQQLLIYGKQVEKEAQERFQRVAPKHWKYQMNLYRRHWGTDLDIFITHPFRCVIDIKSARGYIHQHGKIVKVKDKQTELIHSSNLINQLKVSRAPVLVVWCPLAREYSNDTIPVGKKAIILCNGDEYYLINILKQIEQMS